MNEDQDSVDDPVEDAALLSECEIKRDSVCVGAVFVSHSQSFTGHTDSVLCVAFNQHRPLQFATGGQDDKAFLHQLTEEAPFSVSSRPPAVTPRHNWHEGGVVSVDCHPTVRLRGAGEG